MSTLKNSWLYPQKQKEYIWYTVGAITVIVLLAVSIFVFVSWKQAYRTGK